MKEKDKLTTVQIDPIVRSASFKPSTFDEKSNTVEVVFSTGERVLRGGFFTDPFWEELSLDPQHVRLERLNRGAPVLNNHQRGKGLESVIGVVQSARVDGKQGVAVLRFSERDEVKGLVKDVKDGILRNISIGYRVSKFKKIKAEKEGDHDTMRAIDWTPFEVSFVDIPADPTAQVRSDSLEKNDCVILEERGLEMDEKNENKKQELTDNIENSQERKDSTMDKKDKEVEKPSVDTEAVRAEGVKEERARISAIRKAVKAASLDESFAEKLCEDGTSADVARAQILEELGKRQVTIQNKKSDVEVVSEPGDHFREGMTNALLHRIGHRDVERKADGTIEKRSTALTENGRRFRYFRLTDYIREFAKLKGVDVTGMSAEQIYRAGSLATSDFPLILADVMNKSLRQAYVESPMTWMPITRETEVMDFKTIKRLQLSGAASLDLVGENSEIKMKSMSESREQYAVGTYAEIIPLSRQAIINDDLSAFERIPQMLGSAAARKLSDQVWLQITSNPTMGDGVALFHASHANLGTPGAIAVATLNELRALMRNQTGLAGEVLNLIPRWMAVPAEIEATAQQFLSSTLVPSAPSSVNPFAGSMGLIVEPRLSLLSGGSNNDYYLFADPSQIDVLEVAYLEGRRVPEVVDNEPFDVLGVQFRVVFDFGTKAIDHRGMTKNAGS